MTKGGGSPGQPGSLMGPGLKAFGRKKDECPLHPPKQTPGQAQCLPGFFLGLGTWQPTPVFLPGKSQVRGSLVGYHLWGCTELDTTEAT